MIIKNVKIYAEDRKFLPNEVFVRNSRFDNGEVLDGVGCRTLR